MKPCFRDTSFSSRSNRSFTGSVVLLRTAETDFISRKELKLQHAIYGLCESFLKVLTQMCGIFPPLCSRPLSGISYRLL